MWCAEKTCLTISCDIRSVRTEIWAFGPGMGLCTVCAKGFGIFPGKSLFFWEKNLYKIRFLWYTKGTLVKGSDGPVERLMCMRKTTYARDLPQQQGICLRSWPAEGSLPA